MREDREVVVTKSRAASFGPALAVLGFASLLFAALATTTRSYSPPHAEPSTSHLLKLKGQDLTQELNGLGSPAIIIYRGCDSCSAIDPVALAKTNGALELIWILNEKGEVHRAGSEKITDGSRLLAKLKPVWNPQVFGIDHSGRVKELQTQHFAEKDFVAFFRNCARSLRE